MVKWVTINGDKTMQILNRNEMKHIMAGFNDPDSEPKTCEEFHEETGCYPTWSNVSCEGSDGKTYGYASSSGSCG
jgi:hypothetical protein